MARVMRRHGKMLAFGAALVFLFAMAMRAASAQGSSPEVQALQQSYLEEINKNLQLRASLFTAQEQLVKAQAEIKKLQDQLPKPEPKKEPAK